MANEFFKKVFFQNGYGVSVVSHKNSYGGAEGLFEVAVIDHEENLLYDTPITGDVIGWLDFRDVADVMVKVKSLPKKE